MMFWMINGELRKYVQCDGSCRQHSFGPLGWGQDLRVDGLMSRPVIHVKPDETVDTIKVVLRQEDIRHAPVMDSRGRLVGLISDRDLLGAAAKKREKTHPTVRDVMTERVLVATADASASTIAVAMSEERLSCIPIVDSSGRLDGIITSSDLLAVL